MTERNFRKKWMGYDPAQVDHAILDSEDRVRSASIQMKDADARIASLSDQLIRAERRAAEALEIAQATKVEAEQQTAAAAQAATFDHLGKRVAQVLSLAEAESVEIRADADLYAEEVRIVAEEEGARVIEEARAAAAEQLAAAEKDQSPKKQKKNK